MKSNVFIVALLCFFAVGCNFSSSMLNQEEDKADAEKVANALYSLLSEDKFAESEKLFGEEFFQVSTKEQLTKIFEKTNGTLGRFKSNKLVDWATEEVSGSVNKTEYRLVYEVEYEKYKALETFVLLKKGKDGLVKIIGYHVKSPGFLE